METNNNEYVKDKEEVVDETEEEFYDADDIVDLVEKRFGKLNLEKAAKSIAPLEGQSEDDDFVSLPSVDVEHLKDLEEKVKEMEKEDEKRESDQDERDESDEEEEDKEAYEVNNETYNKF